MDVERELARLLVDEIRLIEWQEHAKGDPAWFIGQLSGWDEREAREFRFNMTDPKAPWFWQRELLDWWLENPRSIVLKARQLGVTWLAAGLALWTALYEPGSLVLIYRQKEEEAAELVGRVWTLFKSLPEDVRSDFPVMTPSRGEVPHTEIKLKASGKISRIVGMTSAAASGHGKSAALVILDEFSHIDKAGSIMKAVSPALGQRGRMLVISTANGVHNPLTGEGNHFHYLWVNHGANGLAGKFLPWHTHPERDKGWYDTAPEVLNLPLHERKEQYPANDVEAFTFSQSVYFDADALKYYEDNVAAPLFQGMFARQGYGEAALKRLKDGCLTVYEKPREDVKYAIGVDTATGRGLDFSSASVIDLSTMRVAADLHGKLDYDQLAFQLHYLGRYFKTALIAVETGGGYGDAVIAFLRDGREGRPPYPKLYRHRQFSRADLREHQPFGFPMTTKTRPAILEYLETSLREHEFPALPAGFLHEAITFVHRTSGPSPAAQDGCHDDRVFSLAIAAEMYRQYGYHPDRKRRRPSKPKSPYPWLKWRRDDPVPVG